MCLAHNAEWGRRQYEAALHKIIGERMRIQGINLEGLKGYLADRQEVAFSFLYGSYGKGTATRQS